MINTIKTALLFIALTLLLIYACKIISQQYGIYFGLLLSVAMNLFIYFYSDQLILSYYQVTPLHEREFAWLYDDAEQLTNKMNIPMPKFWLAQIPIANAFAVGRNPKNSAVVFTPRLLNILERHEIRGILSHELSHIKNRDTLLGTVATTMAGAIGYIGYMLRRGAVTVQEQNEKEKRTPFIDFVLSFVLPIGATLLRLAISRSREFDADATGAYFSREPLALATALEKLETSKQNQPIHATHYPRSFMTEALFIVNPFTTKNWLLELLSTHPPVHERIRRLKEMQEEML